MSLFDFTHKPFSVDKPIRMISLFAGIGAPEVALRNLGVDFEHYRVIEFDPYKVKQYNAIHGTNFEPMDVTEVKGEDLGIVEKDKYNYLLSYSYPCQDVSLAGLRQGMAEGSGTRSSLLWEVRRLLDETAELPDILLMENVPACHNAQNAPEFNRWIQYLTSRGYSTYYDDLNACDYGIAQSRNRTFAVSLLGEYVYHFPEPIELRTVLKDYLEDEVAEKYYMRSEKAEQLIQSLIDRGELPPLNNSSTNKQTNKQTVTTPERYPCDLAITNPKVREVATAVMERQTRGISNIPAQGIGVVECTTTTQR